MDPTTSRPRPPDTSQADGSGEGRQQKFAFSRVPEKAELAPEVQSRVSSDPNTCSAELKPFAAPVDPHVDEPQEPGAGLGWFWLVIYVLFCVELGALLAVLPWYDAVWNNNGLLAGIPAARTLMHNHFVRGAVSGLGLVDMWLGVSEAVRYRERKRKR